MAAPRRFELDELTVRPGTYFNPETEVLLVVDDGIDMDQATFDTPGEQREGADWVLVSDEVPVDEPARDELIESFQARYQSGATAIVPDGDALEEPDGLEEDDELEPDEEPEELV